MPRSVTPLRQHSGVDEGDLQSLLSGVGARLKALRVRDEMTLAELSSITGISVSTLSRLESGQRRPNLELLLPLARAHHVPVDDLIAPAATDDPRVRAVPFTRNGMTFQPLTRRADGLQAYKVVIPGDREQRDPEPATHDGYEWLFVLSGRLRLVLGEHDLLMRAGEAAEFDTAVPHFFDRSGSGAVELLVLFGPQGERMHVRARPRRAEQVG